MGIFNVGASALQAAQVALQTAGNNISNVNTPGYSRQNVVLQPVEGQFSGGGYIGKGVDLVTIQRNVNEFLIRQSALAGATSSSDAMRSDKLNQLQEIFQGGTNGLGASINEMLNSFSDVASAPTDLTARQVVLTRIDETAARLRSTSASLDDLYNGIRQELEQKIAAINTISGNLAAVNEQIARAHGTGQTPNDLLDRREQLVRELNQLVQTSQVPADDGTLSIFIGGSQALVLGTTASTVSLGPDDFADALSGKLVITRGSFSTSLDEETLRGGEVPSLLRFVNTDLNAARNQLGRLTTALAESMNAQHHLGLDLAGNAGGDLLSTTTFTGLNVLTPQAPVSPNPGTGAITLGIADVTQFVPSDYEVQFSNATDFTITRRSDGKVTTHTGAAPGTITLDGLNITVAAGTANGDRFLLKPFSTSASNIQAQFSSPTSLAVASPIASTAASANRGSLVLKNLAATGSAAPLGTSYRVDFTVVAGVTQYSVVNTTGPATVVSATNFVPGQAISYSPGAGLPGFSITLTGAAVNGDSFTVQTNAHPRLDAGNATAMMNLRDVPTFDGANLSDGYANILADIGTRAQSAQYSAQVSQTIANNLEKDRTGISGVNLDEEAAKLLQFQQSYQASAKIIQVAQTVFDTLLQNLAR